ncbi:ABC transporter substrate-binding protein [Corynebacterium phocae]|uniref:ABC transporter substrate-binding protein n=1 Tax=Corynebacterium phocae TaxID=161895 RepID=A0A1L7D1J4_9CORY|nr:anchored repeat ABC transporter, substrate-binding protein [Corynebacterium phocae]APT91933.1 ABC transporter substrate-binding protein [Corynebacterium phocae]KAA8726915.1 anchored repeat ABC transporter, substrate-binding protein [Corynebacterium phocae]
MRVALSIVAAGTLLAGCATGVSASNAPSEADGVFDVVATTPIVADMARNVAGQRARVTALIPPGADPHTFEPGLRSVRNVANADLIFTNGLLLEQQSLLKTAHQSSRPGVPVVAVAEQAPRHGAELIPLVENIALDTVWFGMRIAGTGESLGAQRNSGVEVKLVDAKGPGEAAAYITGTFGLPEVLFNTRDGVDDHDSTTLPVDAHTHVSWAFSQPGFYRLTFASFLDGHTPVGENTITVAVGVDPHTDPANPDPVVLDHGHMDLTTDLDSQEIVIRGDAPEGIDTNYDYDPARTVVEVPSSVLQHIPGDPTFRFLGTAGEETYLLPQAVLGKHVHGEVDPHLWHSVGAAIGMVRVIEEELTAQDPGGRDIYHANANAYVDKLTELDGWMRAQFGSIPATRRHLVTTHDGYAYLGAEYGINVAGFVTPNPAVEPSPRDVIALTRTLENLRVPAVFLEPALAERPGVLSETAHRLGVAVCTIHSDTFAGDVDSYLKLMRANTQEITRCLQRKI